MYSVWSYKDGMYHYYEAPRSGGTHAGVPPRARGSTKVGATPEQAAWPVPFGAKLVGKGASPKGHVASLGASDVFDPVQWALDNAGLITVGAIAIIWMRSKKR